MAERRMFSKTIIDSDVFLDMPQSTQNLYFHLNMRADDEGFVNSPKKIMRMIGSSQNDLEILLSKRYLIAFESGVIVIKHWKLHNTIRKDRMKPTLYTDEKKQIIEKDNGAYTDRQPNDNQMTTNCQRSIVESSIVESSIVESSKQEKPKRKRFSPPSIDDIKNHCKEKGYNVNPEKFYYFYESKGWMVGKNKMKSWEMSLARWNTESKPKAEPKQKIVRQEFTPEQIEKIESMKKTMGII